MQLIKIGGIIMQREEINENSLNQVVGGSIVFNADCSTCGYNRNDQYRILNKDEALSYMRANIRTMDERDILRNLLDRGLLEEI